MAAFPGVQAQTMCTMQYVPLSQLSRQFVLLQSYGHRVHVHNCCADAAAAAVSAVAYNKIHPL
jgi:hypothetical protein